MAKIKVNELTQQTPTLNDTIVASGEDKEYACKVDDLKTLIGRKEIYQDLFYQYQQNDEDEGLTSLEVSETKMSFETGDMGRVTFHRQ